MRLVHILFLAISSLSNTLEAVWTLPNHHGGRKCIVLFNERSDCGFLGITRDECLARGCCWRPVPSARRGIPWCFHPRSLKPPYFIDPLSSEQDRITLRHRDAENLHHAPASLHVDLEYQSDTVHVTIAGQKGPRVPNHLYEEMPGYPMPRASWSRHGAHCQLHVDLMKDPFQLQVRRREDSCYIFNTEARSEEDLFDSIIVKNNYVEIGTQLPANHYIYGLGERAGPFRKKADRMAMNARDTPVYEKLNTYGAHPFYLELRSDGIAHGVFVLNSHPMEVELTETSLVYHMLGGIIDMYFFAGPSADQVIEQYTRVIGRPPLYEPKFFGLHQCRFGYKTLQDWQRVVAGFEAHKLPLDGIWFDIEYLIDPW